VGAIDSMLQGQAQAEESHHARAGTTHSRRPGHHAVRWSHLG
jgi:hypothetical protein